VFAFDASGNRVCTSSNDQCTSSLNCPVKNYCSDGGTCLPNGECSTQADCRNPDNKFSCGEGDEAGTGILECNDLDRCWIQCTSFNPFP
jgi:hypothetical protein